jgi:hypothetical protein
VTGLVGGLRARTDLRAVARETGGLLKGLSAGTLADAAPPVVGSIARLGRAVAVTLIAAARRPAQRELLRG